MYGRPCVVLSCHSVNVIGGDKDLLNIYVKFDVLSCGVFCWTERWQRRAKRGRVPRRQAATLVERRTNMTSVCWSAISAWTRLATPSSACADTCSGTTPSHPYVVENPDIKKMVQLSMLIAFVTVNGISFVCSFTSMYLKCIQNNTPMYSK